MKTVLQAVARYWKKLDKPLLFAAMLCSALSVVLLYSIYINHTLSEIDDDDYIIQLVAVGIGVLSVLVLAAIDYHKIARLWFVYAPIALILVLLTFTSLGYRRAGADDQAWLQLGSVTLQPSEILKLAFILTFSLHLAKDEENMNRPLHMLLLILHGCMPIGLVFLQGIEMGGLQMKRDKLTFLIAELILIVLAAFFIHKIFQEDVAQKRVAVILQNSGDTRWEGVINGLKQSAKTNNLHLIICNTDDIVSAQDERELIEEQLENDVDAFILCPAPGADTKEMLDWLGEQKKPFVLLTEDVYTGEQPEASGYATVKPDNYQIGYTLGTQLITQDEDGLKGKRIGVIAGRSKTEASVNRIQGLKDALEKQDCEIAWEYNEESDTDICAVVDAQESVDYMVVMDTQALDTLGEHAENGVYKDAKIFGVGTSMKSIALLDAGQVQCLVIPDGYGIGYESVEEIEKELTRTFYTLKSHEKEVKVIYKEDLFSDEIERFLYSYE